MNPSDQPDILLISVDSMRRDLMSPYGNDNMPTVTQLMRHAASFDNCFASSSWTGASFGSLHTGLWPRQHKCLSAKSSTGDKRKGSSLNPDVLTLAELLGKAGYHNICSQGNPCHVGVKSGFDRGFDDYFGWNLDWNLSKARRELKAFAGAFNNGKFLQYSSFFCKRLLERLKFLHFAPIWPMTEGSFIVRKALKMLQGSPDQKPVFMWVNFMDLHSPYPVPGRPLAPKAVPSKIRYYHKQPRVCPSIEYSKDDKITTKALYEHSAKYVDEQIGNMIESFQTIRTNRPRLTIFVSDHGEEFWDHGIDGRDRHFYNTGVEHGHTLYNELISVPMIMHWPEVIKSGRSIQGATSLIDILPTIAELLELPKPSCGYGAKSLAAQVTSESCPSASKRTVFAESLAYGLERQAAISDTHKLIYCPETGQKELYAWAKEDPQEKQDLSGSSECASILDELFAELKKWNDTIARDSAGIDMVEEDDEVAKQLRALGYL